MAVKAKRHGGKTVRGPRRASWRRPSGRPASKAGAGRGRTERRETPREAPLSEYEEEETGAVVDERMAREAEAIEEEEDDFADGRSSAGRTLREEEDLWGRGIAPGDRPFEESDVPARPPEPPEVSEGT